MKTIQNTSRKKYESWVIALNRGNNRKTNKAGTNSQFRLEASGLRPCIVSDGWKE